MAQRSEPRTSQGRLYARADCIRSRALVNIATMYSGSSDSPPTISVLETITSFRKWVMENPVAAALLVGCIATLVYYFGFYQVFTNGSKTTARWAMEGWNSENDLEHGWLILPAALVVVWLH